MIETVLSRKELLDEPPVLVDVGASGDVFGPWARIAPFAHCIAFDPDVRDIAIIEGKSSGFRSLRVLPRIVADRSIPDYPFHLARSPHCSSCLPPDQASLSAYSFASAFETVKKASLPATTLADALREVGLPRVDWLKVDAQGLDLRVFKHLPPDVADTLLVVDFEPGIMAAYQGEDRLHHLMAHMEGRPYWCSGFEIKGDFRIDEQLLAANFGAREIRLLQATHRRSPGWAQLQYFASFPPAAQRPMRDYLLGWVFATVVGHHLFALQLAVTLERQFGDAQASDLIKASRGAVRRDYLRAFGSRAARAVWAVLPMFRPPQA